jgi:hypothetical protein
MGVGGKMTKEVYSKAEEINKELKRLKHELMYIPGNDSFPKILRRFSIKKNVG